MSGQRLHTILRDKAKRRQPAGAIAARRDGARQAFAFRQQRSAR